MEKKTTKEKETTGYSLAAAASHMKLGGKVFASKSSLPPSLNVTVTVKCITWPKRR